jgi:putative endonuclease
LDIVAREGDELVFIEVKRRKDSTVFTVNEAVTWAKRTALVKAANRYLLEMNLIHLTGRFDVIYLAEQRDGAFCLYHIENAFY